MTIIVSPGVILMGTNPLFEAIVNNGDITPHLHMVNDILDGWSPLMVACRCTKNINVINALIQAGANVNHQNRDGRTALMVAARYTNTTCSDEIIIALIKAGAQVNMCDKTLHTALMVACFSNADTTFETIITLIDCGAEINAQNKDGFTALAFQCQQLMSPNLDGSVFIRIKLLIKCGANVNLKLESGWSPLMFYAIHSSNDIDNRIGLLLLKSGANVENVLITGANVLILACSFSKKTNAQDILYNHGARADLAIRMPFISHDYWVQVRKSIDCNFDTLGPIV